jgi:hypothetical protein
MEHYGGQFPAPTAHENSAGDAKLVQRNDGGADQQAADQQQVTSWAAAEMSASAMNSKPAPRITGGRPARSEMKPATAAPTAAPASAIATTIPCSVGESAITSRMKSSAPEMTPVCIRTAGQPALRRTQSHRSTWRFAVCQDFEFLETSALQTLRVVSTVLPADTPTLAVRRRPGRCERAQGPGGASIRLDTRRRERVLHSTATRKSVCRNVNVGG